MDNLPTKAMVAVQDGLAEVRASGMATFFDRMGNTFHDVMSYVTANGMAFLALAVVGMLLTILGAMAFNAYKERQIELMFAEEEAGKLQAQVWDLETQVYALKMQKEVQTDIIRRRDITIDLQINAIENLEEQVADLTETVEAQSNDIVEMGDANKHLHKLVGILRGEVNDRDETIAELESNLESADERVEELEEELYDANNTIESKDDEIYDLKLAITDLKVSNEELEEANDNLTTLVELHKQLVAANEEVFAEAA